MLNVWKDSTHAHQTTCTVYISKNKACKICNLIDLCLDCGRIHWSEWISSCCYINVSTHFVSACTYTMKWSIYDLNRNIYEYFAAVQCKSLGFCLGQGFFFENTQKKKILKIDRLVVEEIRPIDRIWSGALISTSTKKIILRVVRLWFLFCKRLLNAWLVSCSLTLNTCVT